MDNETGLPKVLKEGDYWVINNSALRKTWARIGYLRPRKYWFDKVMSSEEIVLYGPMTPRDVQRKAKTIIEKVRNMDAEVDDGPTKEEIAAYRERLAARRAQGKLDAIENAKMFGKYPPKSLYRKD